MIRTLAALFLILGCASAAAETVRRSVTLEWYPIEGAVSYDVEIKRKPDGNPLQRNFAGQTGVLELEPGSYEMRVRSRDKRKVPGDWSPVQEFEVFLAKVEIESPKAGQKINAPKPDEISLDIKWKPVPGADEYLLELVSEDGKVKIQKSVKQRGLQVTAPVGHLYTLKVQAVSASGVTSGDPIERKFTVWGTKLESPEIEVNETGYVREVKWTRPLYADEFDYDLSKWDAASKKWVNVKKGRSQKDSRFDFLPSWSGGTYRFAIKAKASYRGSSAVVSRKFGVVTGDRSPAAEMEGSIRRSIVRTRGWYFLASYLITQMDYSGVNADNGGLTKLRVNLPANLGGTGRLGVGYLSDKTPWGFAAILDLSGFIVAGLNPTFASLEANAVLRSDLGARAEIRQQFGAYYKEMPEIIARNLNDIEKIDKITSAGPHYGVEYWYAVTNRLGFQVNGHLYSSMLTIKTPTGNPIQPSLTYQAGLLGSYRYGQNVTLLGGYAYRTDSASYQAENGSENSVQITGHYLNFFLEWPL